MNALNKHMTPNICRLCGHQTTPHLVDARGYDLHRCTHCDFVQVWPQPTLEELDKIYQEAYFGHNKYRDEATLRAENERRLQLVRDHTPDGDLLEVGCGDGSFAEIAKAHYTVSGFDLSAAGVEKAQARNPDLRERLWVDTLETLTLAPNSYDVICLWDVIEHIWDPAPGMEKLWNGLKPGGLLVISTPNIGARTAKLMGKRWAFMTPPEHLSFFDKQSMTYLFETHLNGEIIHWRSVGKRANIGFILYKIKRVVSFFPSFIIKLFDREPLSKLAIYVPTGDIQYLVVRKR